MTPYLKKKEHSEHLSSIKGTAYYFCCQTIEMLLDIQWWCNSKGPMLHQHVSVFYASYFSVFMHFITLVFQHSKHTNWKQLKQRMKIHRMQKKYQQHWHSTVPAELHSCTWSGNNCIIWQEKLHSEPSKANVHNEWGHWFMIAQKHTEKPPHIMTDILL